MQLKSCSIDMLIAVIKIKYATEKGPLNLFRKAQVVLALTLVTQ